MPYFKSVGEQESYARDWWLFGEKRGALREALCDLSRFIITPETSKHWVFEFADVGFCPDHTLYAIALGRWWHLGVLSSRVHVLWATSAGGRLGIGNDPRYNNTRCFYPFPFPAVNESQRASIGRAAEALVIALRAAQARSPRATLTRIYNLILAVRGGAALSEAQRALHTHAWRRPSMSENAARPSCPKRRPPRAVHGPKTRSISH